MKAQTVVAICYESGCFLGSLLAFFFTMSLYSLNLLMVLSLLWIFSILSILQMGFPSSTSLIRILSQPRCWSNLLHSERLSHAYAFQIQFDPYPETFSQAYVSISDLMGCQNFFWRKTFGATRGQKHIFSVSVQRDLRYLASIPSAVDEIEFEKNL